jgi:hypothetical protein
MKHRRVVNVPLAILLLCNALIAQSSQGRILGTVTDERGAAVKAAKVVITNIETAASRTLETNEAGDYVAPNLAPGLYRVVAEAAGFKRVERTSVRLEVAKDLRIDLALPAGQLSESVTVTDEPPAIETTSTTLGGTFSNKSINDLPLNGRNYLQLVSLAPNVSTGFSGQGQAGARQGGIRAAQTISVAGQRTNFNHYTLDGVENTDPNFNTFVVMPSIDALQEFKVQTGVYPAEFGRQTTQINVLTKSGTNQYHGTLFEFLRNNNLDALPYGFTAKTPTS